MMDLAAMMGGGPEGGGAAPAGPPPSTGGGESDPAQEIQEALNALQEILLSATDPEVQAAVSTAESALSKLVLALQKQKDAAMGTTPAHKYVERASAGGGGGGY